VHAPETQPILSLPRGFRPIGPGQPSSSAVAGLVIVMSCWHQAVIAANAHTESFDERRATSRVILTRATGRVESHDRLRDGGVSNSACERVSVVTRRLGTELRWEQPVPPARVIDDVVVALQVLAQGEGLRMSVRVVFPHELDPRTGTALTDLVPGPRYDTPGRWQGLQMSQLRDALSERLVLLRARLKKPGLDSRDAYLDRVVLTCVPDPGRTVFAVDDLSVGPIVAPPGGVLDAVSAQSFEQSGQSPATMRLDQFHVHGVPFLPLAVMHRGESPRLLKSTGANLVLIADHRNRELVDSLRSEGLWVMAVPPKPPAVAGQLATAGTAAMVPIGAESEGILCWYLDAMAHSGSRLSANGGVPRLGWNAVTGWVEQLRHADRRSGRPIIADVEGFEHAISRYRLLPAISRRVIGTGLKPSLFRRWLEQHRDQTRPGSLAWTWVEVDAWGIEIEPEQIEMQVRTALAAGYRGLGFRTQRRLDSQQPAAKERRLMIGLINGELELLAPFLATSTKVGTLPVTVGRTIDPEDPSSRSTAAAPAQRQAAGRVRRRRRVVATNPRTGVRIRPPRVDRRVQAVLFRTDVGRLLMLNWLDDNDQFSPGHMALTDLEIVVPGGDETATAWEIRATGIRSLPARRVAGGIALSLDRFDRSSSIVLTSDPRAIARLRQRVSHVAPRAARMSLEMAQARFERVRVVDTALTNLGRPQPDARRLIARAAGFLSQSARLLEQQAHADSHRYSEAVLQAMRILQRAHWEQAVQESDSPLASTFSRGFQRLPRHWELMNAFREREGQPGDGTEGGTGKHRLVGGRFDDLPAMIQAGWQSRRAEVPGMTMTAEVYQGGDQRAGRATGGSCLRLMARPLPQSAAPRRLPPFSVIVDSPAVRVGPGDLVKITGRIRLVSARPGSLDGGVIEDTLGGPGAGLECRHPGSWRRFALYRRARQAGEVQVRIGLEGMGEFRVDDLEIEVFEDVPDRPAEGGLAAPGGSPTFEPPTTFTESDPCPSPVLPNTRR